MNGAIYAMFLSNMFKSYYCQTKSLTIISDNASIHKTQEVKDVYVSTRLQHTNKHTPPYSPHLNPVESCFSQLQSFVNHRIVSIHTQTQFIACIKLAIDSVTKEECANYYAHVNKYYFSCIAKKPLD